MSDKEIEFEFESSLTIRFAKWRWEEEKVDEFEQHTIYSQKTNIYTIYKAMKCTMRRNLSSRFHPRREEIIAWIWAVEDHVLTQRVAPRNYTNLVDFLVSKWAYKFESTVGTRIMRSLLWKFRAGVRELQRKLRL